MPPSAYRDGVTYTRYLYGRADRYIVDSYLCGCRIYQPAVAVQDKVSEVFVDFVLEYVAQHSFDCHKPTVTPSTVYIGGGCVFRVRGGGASGMLNGFAKRNGLVEIVNISPAFCADTIAGIDGEVAHRIVSDKQDGVCRVVNCYGSRFVDMLINDGCAFNFERDAGPLVMIY